MKKIQKTFYVCEYCNKEFEKKSDAEFHEKHNHICPECEHCWWLYGSEQRCDLGNSKCSFKQKIK